MRVIAIIQARMGSSRLPGKVIQDLAGQPMLARVVSRSRRSKMLHEVVVATTTDPADKIIVDLCIAYNWPYFRGSEEDVLDRYYQAALRYKSDAVVRVTSDCPLVDPEIINLVAREFIENSPLDYASNTLPPRTFPLGLDVEVIGFSALERAWREDDNLAWREHVTPYICRHAEKFALRSVVNSVDYSSMRWTVDTREDLAFVRKIYDYFGHDEFSWQDVLVTLEEHEDWLEINRHIVQKEAP